MVHLEKSRNNKYHSDGKISSCRSLLHLKRNKIYWSQWPYLKTPLCDWSKRLACISTELNSSTGCSFLPLTPWALSGMNMVTHTTGTNHHGIADVEHWARAPHTAGGMTMKCHSPEHYGEVLLLLLLFLLFWFEATPHGA